MRLIHTTNLNLKWFTWKKIPGYAILSHTWESDDQTDIIKDPTHPSSKKAGYRKIISACKVARDNNLDYIWVDTCCIEKESSSELSEAINSMYRWYQNAKVCYAYLSDLKAGIFGVNMPMLYGEGPNAFLRLQEQIVLSSNDLSIFAFDLNSKPTNPSGRIVIPYCDMFAESPDAFKNHGAREYPETEPHWNEAFTVTNRGIYFQRARLHTDMRNGVYCMILNTEYPSLNHGFIYLQKVGPRLFARCAFDDSGRHSGDNELPSSQVEEDMYIIKHITPLRLQQLIDADEYSIQVTSETHILTPTALEVLDGFPWSKHWDESRMKHLTRGENEFRGCWKLYPDFAESLLGTAVMHPTIDFVYLTCGLIRRQNHRHPKPSVCLYHADKWEEVEGALEFFPGYSTGDQELVLSNPGRGDKTTITVHIELQEGNIPRFQLRINMKTTKR
ncbi:thermophilic desulfurizing enzyme family protein [Rutstroemia sp. NJR-2017a BBW]|nr:thermophilic desulfurizing enzyme family protein [Rutstroemia sp. NJR-2017a BBW]